MEDEEYYKVIWKYENGHEYAWHEEDEWVSENDGTKYYSHNVAEEVAESLGEDGLVIRHYEALQDDDLNQFYEATEDKPGGSNDK